MANLIVVCGPQAVGKMTVAESLRDKLKYNMMMSKSNLLSDAANHRLNSEEGEVWFEHHIKIDNTHLSPDEVADMVIEKFKLVANEKEEKEYRFGV